MNYEYSIVWVEFERFRIQMQDSFSSKSNTPNKTQVSNAFLVSRTLLQNIHDIHTFEQCVCVCVCMCLCVYVLMCACVCVCVCAYVRL